MRPSTDWTSASASNSSTRTTTASGRFYRTRKSKPWTTWLTLLLCGRTLDGSSLTHFKFLEELRLHGNKLRDLQSTLYVLGRLHHLHDLDLFGNPIAEEEGYRYQVIAAIPSLRVLDRHVVTDDDRTKAAMYAPVSPLHDQVELSDTGHEMQAVEEKQDEGSPTGRQTTTQQVKGSTPHFSSWSSIAANVWHGQDLDERGCGGQARATGAESNSHIVDGHTKLTAYLQQKAIEEAQRELQELESIRQQSFTAFSSTRGAGTDSKNRACPIPALDEWETAALKKFFLSTESAKNGYCALSRLTSYTVLTSCSYQMPNNGASDSSMSQLTRYLRTRGFNLLDERGRRLNLDESAIPDACNWESLLQVSELCEMCLSMAGVAHNAS